MAPETKFSGKDLILYLVLVYFSILRTQAYSQQKGYGGLDSTHSNITDTNRIKGNLSVTGFIESGDENKNVFSLISLITLGNSRYQIEPLTSLAYSSKPGAQIEGEYLENIIIRYHQGHLFYPAIGISFDKSFLRKIDYRVGAGITLVCNVLNSHQQTIKLGLGYKREFSQFREGAFNPEYIPGNNFYGRRLDQVYIRLKGKNSFFNRRCLLSYDFFYQPSLNGFSDYRWTGIGNLDIPFTRKMDLRTSFVSTYESFVATKVSNYNFRITTGINLNF